ncbi:glycosyltransferase family A protein [Microbispora bryophytorum]|uniref:glycosyltransferase family A protein n=1 Tax=Microbispora bryophytorum TaxID=1460882 RepID=UPI0033EFBDAD
MFAPSDLDVLVPTKDRTGAPAVTLAGLAAQTVSGFRVVISDQSHEPVGDDPLVAARLRILDHRAMPAAAHRHLPPRGMAEQRAFLLGHAGRRLALYLDDDVWLEPEAIEVLPSAIGELRCGFAGYALHGLSYRDDVRPAELAPYEEWPDGVRPERVRREPPAWHRHTLHNASNPLHLAREHLGAPAPREWRPYKVAWIELPTTVTDRRAECYDYLFETAWAH